MIWLSLPLHQHSLPLCTYHASSSNRWHFPNILCCLIFCALHILDDSSVLLASWTCLFFIFCGSSDNYLHETPHSSLPSLLSIILYLFFFFFPQTAWRVGSSFPDQGLNPCPLQWKCRLNHWTAREVPRTSFYHHHCHADSILQCCCED